ncbi:hypothetical protein LEMLEM_LOCUS7271 [Lemmus lemmus]
MKRNPDFFMNEPTPLPTSRQTSFYLPLRPTGFSSAVGLIT